MILEQIVANQVLEILETLESRIGKIVEKEFKVNFEKMKYCDAELKKENEDLKKNLARYSAKIYEQEAQIERMKCCENCDAYDGNCNTDHETDCKHWNILNINDFWELKK